MARPLKWSRELSRVRERALGSRIETWGRRDLEELFGVGRVAAQGLAKVIGGVQPVAGAYFVDRESLLRFLDSMAAAENVEAAFRERLLQADSPPRPRPLRSSLPADLRSATLRDLPQHIHLSSGRLEIVTKTTAEMVDALFLVAQVLQNDYSEVERIVEPPALTVKDADDAELEAFLRRLRGDPEPGT